MSSSLFLTQLIETEGETEELSKIFLKNRHSFEFYVPYALNRQFSETTLNTYKIIRKFFNVKSNIMINYFFRKH